MTPNDILNAWIKYSEYDPEQKKFNLLSSNYHMHKASDAASAIMDYDPSGSIAVLYLKEMFQRLCENSTFKMIDLMEHPEALGKHKQMWDMFHSEGVRKIEDAILGAMDGIIQKIVPEKQIGERDIDAERSVLAESIIGVVEELKKCHVELFMKARHIGRLSSFSTEIHVFETLSQCLLTLESAPDSMYICYIRNKDTADGYFGFFIKSDGNLLSINERVREAYPGQHQHARNGRWAESKAFQIFPYKLMQDVGDRDYLGYANHMRLDDSNLKLFKLGPDAYIPLVLSMVMLSMKYGFTPTDEYPLCYVDALLPHNLELSQKSEETALVIPDNSLVVSAHESYVNTLTTESVLTGRAGADFDRLALNEAGRKKDWTATGSFPQAENIFIDLYGEGFELDKDALLEKDKDLLLPDSADFPVEKTDHFEFVGTWDNLDLIAYRAARIQLAEYIRDQMYKEYIAFGGKEAIRAWFAKQIESHKNDILQLCAEAYAEAEANHEAMNATALSTLFQKRRNSGLYIGIDLSKSGVTAYGNGIDHPFNKNYVYTGRTTRKWICPIELGAKATYDFKIHFTDWKEMAQVFGEENIPKILRGYRRDGRHITGNSILNCVDYVEGVGTPFENCEYQQNSRYWTKDRWRDYFWRDVRRDRYNLAEISEMINRAPDDHFAKSPSTMHFGFSVALSKRGLNKILKEMP